MSGTILRLAAVVLFSGLCLSCSDAPTPITNSHPNGAQSGSQSRPATTPQAGAAANALKLRAPDGWTSEATTSDMRVSQYRLPRAEGDPEDASLVVYYFGQGQGGSVDANLERWAGQMGQTLDKAQKQAMAVNGLNVTLLDVKGNYSASMTPGSAAKQEMPNSRLRAAVIETPNGPYFVKLLGPARTIDRWDQEFISFVKSAEFKSASR